MNSSYPFNRRDFARLLGAAAFANLAPSISAAAAWAPNDKKKVGMIVRSARQENLEMPLEGFLDNYTPVEHMFTRSHHYPAKVDLATWNLEITGAVSNPQKLNFEAIRKLPRVEMPAVMECAGNGRGFYEPSMPGLQWGHGAVANGKWAGVRLADVLKLAGADESAVDLVFDGADVPIGTMPEFMRSIPVKKGLDPDVLLAYELNGQPLPTAHGFPLRVVVPGWSSDCWVKWLTRIDVSKKEFDGFFMKTAYRHPGRIVRPGTAVDPAAMSPVTELRPKSVIARPFDGTQVEVGKAVNFRGVAWSGGGHRVTYLQLSINDGISWFNPQIEAYFSDYAWRPWQYTLIPETEGYLRIMVRAGDDSGNMQPMLPSWNPSGYLWNPIHTIGLNVVKQIQPDAPPAPAPAKNTPPAIVSKTCGTCHQDDVIRQQRLTKGQWEKEVDKMGRWGAQIKPADREAIIDYLSKEYPYHKL